MKHFAGILSLMLFVSSSFAADAPAGKVELVNATYKQIDEVVAKCKGKVVVVDIWSIYCIPCKKRFPHLVAMHDRLAKSGLAVVSIASDDSDEREKCLNFLKEKNATMANYFLIRTPEPTKELDEKYPTNIQPILIVFDRDGKRVKQFDGKDEEKEIDQLIEKLIAAK